MKPQIAQRTQGVVWVEGSCDGGHQRNPWLALAISGNLCDPWLDICGLIRDQQVCVLVLTGDR